MALEAAANLPALVPQEHQEVLEAVLALPKKYKDVVYLHYYEGTPPRRSRGCSTET